MDRELDMASKGWINTFNADIKSKVSVLLKESNTTPEDLAEVIGVDSDEIYDILDNNGENISIETLVKVFMILGFAIEIKPIEATPLGNYGNIRPNIMFDECNGAETEDFARAPMPNPFMSPRAPRAFGREFPRPNRMPNFGGIGREPICGGAPSFREPTFTRREVTASPFENMDDERLKQIIRRELWDSEIDLLRASHRELVNFLNEKNKRKQEVIRKENERKKVTEELERDPQVSAFVKRMKKNIKDNPQFRSYMKNFLKNLDEQ